MPNTFQRKIVTPGFTFNPYPRDKRTLSSYSREKRTLSDVSGTRQRNILEAITSTILPSQSKNISRLVAKYKEIKERQKAERKAAKAEAEAARVAAEAEQARIAAEEAAQAQAQPVSDGTAGFLTILVVAGLVYGGYRYMKSQGTKGQETQRA